MKIVNELPPVYDAIVQAGMKPSPNVIYAYGSIIYNPSGGEVPPDLIVHEETHCRQQGDDPDGWWSSYIYNKYFRIDQEVEAYAYQFNFLCKTIKDRNRQDKILRNIATSLSSPTYGNMIGSQSAYLMIKNKAESI